MACNLTAKEVERVCKYLSELLGEPVEFYQRAFGEIARLEALRIAKNEPEE